MLALLRVWCQPTKSCLSLPVMLTCVVRIRTESTYRVSWRHVDTVLSVRSKVPQAGPATAAIFHGLGLILEVKGVSDEMLLKLSKTGIAVTADLLRNVMTRAAAEISSVPTGDHCPSGCVPVKLEITDNADFRMFSTVVSVIPILLRSPQMTKSSKICKYLLCIYRITKPPGIAFNSLTHPLSLVHQLHIHPPRPVPCRIHSPTSESSS